MHSSGIYFIGQGINPTSVDTFHIFIGKLTLDGHIDQTFGTNGFFSDTLLGQYSNAGSLIVDDEDRIVWCGSSEVQSSQQDFPVIGRLTIDGQRDSTFGGTGIEYWDYYGGGIVDLINVEPEQYKHSGEGAFLTEIVQVNENYFVFGRYIQTAYAELHEMAFTKQGLTFISLIRGIIIKFMMWFITIMQYISRFLQSANNLVVGTLFKSLIQMDLSWTF